MRCSKCKKRTPIKSFATFRTRKGELRRRGICRECRWEYGRDNFERLKIWRRDYNFKNRSARALRSAAARLSVRKVLDSIKSKARCADCRRKFPPVAMDFDHVRGKNMTIATMASAAYKIGLILEEIKFCDIVCACCHRIRTAARKQNHAPKKLVIIGR